MVGNRLILNHYMYLYILFYLNSWILASNIPSYDWVPGCSVSWLRDKKIRGYGGRNTLPARR